MIVIVVVVVVVVVEEKEEEVVVVVVYSHHCFNFWPFNIHVSCVLPCPTAAHSITTHQSLFSSPRLQCEVRPFFD